MRYVYPCNIVRDEEEAKATGREAYNVSFPDVPEALTCGWSWAEAIAMAEDGLAVALGMYVKSHQHIPKPSLLADGQVAIAVPPLVAAKLILYIAMREQRITYVALAAKMGLHESAVRRIVDPTHRSHMTQIENALRAVGRSLVIEDRVAV